MSQPQNYHRRKLPPLKRWGHGQCDRGSWLGCRSGRSGPWRVGCPSPWKTRGEWSPVEVGSFSHYLQGLIQGLVVVWDFWTTNSMLDDVGYNMVLVIFKCMPCNSSHSRNRASELFQAKVIRRSHSKVWGFPKMVVPNNHRFSYLTSSCWGALGVPPFKETTIYMRDETDTCEVQVPYKKELVNRTWNPERWGFFVDSRQFGNPETWKKSCSSMCYNFEHDMKAISSFAAWLCKHKCPKEPFLIIPGYLFSFQL